MRGIILTWHCGWWHWWHWSTTMSQVSFFSLFSQKFCHFVHLWHCGWLMSPISPTTMSPKCYPYKSQQKLGQRFSCLEKRYGGRTSVEHSLLDHCLCATWAFNFILLFQHAMHANLRIWQLEVTMYCPIFLLFSS